MGDIETVDYNNSTNINDLNNINLKKTIGEKNHQKIKEFIRKKGHLNIAEKSKPYSRPNKETQEGVVFLKQVPVHPKDRLARKTKDEVKFVKQVPLHPKERLKRKRKTTLENYNQLSKKSKINEMTFVKQMSNMFWGYLGH